MKYFPRLLLRCPFELVEVGGKTTAVSVGSESFDYNGVIELNNDSTVFMFKKLQDGITLPELIKACMDEYGDPVEEVGPIVLSFLDSLKNQNLLMADTQHGIKIDDGKE